MDYFIYWRIAKVQNISDMARFSGKNRKGSTVIRDNEVHQAYHDLCIELGSMSRFVSKQYIYERIRARTGLCHKTLALFSFICLHNC